LIGAVSLFVPEVVLLAKELCRNRSVAEVLAGAGQEEFDEIAIPRANGRNIVARIGPRLSLRFTDGNQPARRLAATAALRLYDSRFGANLRSYQANASTRVVRPNELPCALRERMHFAVVATPGMRTPATPSLFARRARARRPGRAG
jgi:hypothetical protein